MIKTIGAITVVVPRNFIATSLADQPGFHRFLVALPPEQDLLLSAKHLFVEAMIEKSAAFRQRRAADTARWRERLHRGAAVYPVEVDGQLFDLMERFGVLKDSKTGDRQAVATALGRLLRRALAALLREEAASRR
jgi:hypothetical protein